MFLSPFRTPFQNPFPKEGAAALTYATILRDTYGASEVWPLVNISSGTTISAFVNSARNGTLTGWDLKSAAGPIAGTLAPYSDGGNDVGNIYTSSGVVGLNEIWNGDVGSVFIWLYGSNSIAGTDIALYLSRLDSNRVWIEFAAGGNIKVGRTANSAEKSVTTPISGKLGAWHSWGASWSTSADQFKAYYDGIQLGSTQTGLTAWALPGLRDIQTCIGAYRTDGVLSFNGYFAYLALKVGSIWSPTDFLAMHTAAATAAPDI